MFRGRFFRRQRGALSAQEPTQYEIDGFWSAVSEGEMRLMKDNVEVGYLTGVESINASGRGASAVIYELDIQTDGQVFAKFSKVVTATQEGSYVTIID